MTVVFFVECAQGPGYRALCKTLLGAKRWLMQCIIDHQAKKDPASRNDPNPWEGWTWWRGENGDLNFSGGNQQRIAEGGISEMEIIED